MPSAKMNPSLIAPRVFFCTCDADSATSMCVAPEVDRLGQNLSATCHEQRQLQETHSPDGQEEHDLGAQLDAQVRSALLEAVSEHKETTTQHLCPRGNTWVSHTSAFCDICQHGSAALLCASAWQRNGFFCGQRQHCHANTSMCQNDASRQEDLTRQRAEIEADLTRQSCAEDAVAGLVREKSTLQAISELEMLKQQLLHGVPLEQSAFFGAGQNSEIAEGVESGDSSAEAFMESMEQMDQELDEQLKTMAAALQAAKAQRAELVGMHSTLQSVSGHACCLP